MLKISEFQTKDVVNVMDGKKLGQITDLEINTKAGRIEGIVVPGKGNGKFLGIFGSAEEIVIPWQNIVKIGRDVILVRLDETVVPFKPGKEEV
ncbi:YlmC/YmxH family sporulation protein [Aneurinibacillus sp. Ricciae_BoGa-3]|uniref:YlmC/YmxH family sporulation protein n=1 Tax=Aneurinibacillus sp. Ricciae_BoGa-3 TaxID=3022697 RepID=UPI002341DE3E|nr:YlmC/YmxH family sporulation protein [Aneurinibacillus sp. Ricciae_BoGa-3]WCK53067.1 YlmC/YmxH family sporulation protein [Aneurinibacillus sp. Ricciae_BoGa-3]